MGFKTDIEIAQETEMLPITEIAKKAGKIRDISELASTNETSFDELFPPLNKDGK